MLFLVFHLGRERYALPAREVVEVLPLVHIKRLPQTPPGIAGVAQYRCAPVPVVDLRELVLGQASAARLSTRLVFVRVPGEDGAPRLLGLIVEKATATYQREPDSFVASGVRNDATPYLGPVAGDAAGLVQRLEVQQLLPPQVRDMLFLAADAA